MKRSEIIDIISKILEENLETRYIDVSYTATADFVLRVLEKKGMQPPVTTDPVLFRKENKWDNE